MSVRFYASEIQGILVSAGEIPNPNYRVFNSIGTLPPLSDEI
jgi:hypothetical protein